MRLSKMQDIAGLRVEPVQSRHTQDRVVSHLVRVFASARVVDRRPNPSFGYRAVHVIAEIRGCPVEIQVRTKLQNLWAQVVERLGDRWGRQIRYGLPPTEPDRSITASLTRGEVFKIVSDLSEVIDTHEVGEESLEDLQDRLSLLEDEGREDEAEPLRVMILEAHAVMREQSGQLEDILKSLGEAAEYSGI